MDLLWLDLNRLNKHKVSPKKALTACSQDQFRIM